MLKINKIHIFTGLMKSGKTTALIKQIQSDGGNRVVITGSATGIIKARGFNFSIEQTEIKPAYNLYIDEIHMIDIDKIFKIVSTVKPKCMYVAGLSNGVLEKKFDHIQKFTDKYKNISKEFTITHFNTICEHKECEEIATTHIRESSSKKVIQEDKGLYKTVCYNCALCI